MNISLTMKEKFYKEGNILPFCINKGCSNNIAVREWKNWSFKSECSSCMNARKENRDIPGVIRHKKRYCENNDSRLGFNCPVHPSEWDSFQESLDMDHLDGNHFNNVPENVDTYCKLCHFRKSKEEGDWDRWRDTARIIEKPKGNTLDAYFS
mgnify:FL=1